MHQALYRKWRPKTFSQVCGQAAITDALRFEAAQDKLSHAYLFCGSRGTGKTSCAKILAKAANCEHPQNGEPCGICDACRMIDAGTATDVLEMDAASNNGVDHIREIRDAILFTPGQLKNRVYIIDEVHMLSASAFNALLKTLEEPPAHVIFILATTELQKLPATIISRCQRFDFKRIAAADIAAHLSQIAQAEGMEAEPDALLLIARLAQGGMRDAISMLELCAGSGQKVTPQAVLQAVGALGRETIAAAIDAILNHDSSAVFSTVASLYASGRDTAVFWQDMLAFYRDMLVLRSVRGAADYLDLTEQEMRQTSELAARFSIETLLAHCRMMDEALTILQRSGGATGRTSVELTLVRMMDLRLVNTPEALLARIASLETRLATLSAAPISPPPAKEEKPSESLPQEAPPHVHPAPGPAKQQNMPEKKIWQELPFWREVVGAYDAIDKTYTPILLATHAYKEQGGNCLILRTNGNPFYTLKLQNQELLRKFLSLAQQYDSELTSIRLDSQAKSAETPASDTDQLLTALEQASAQNH